MNDNTYNGWTNFSTWEVNLWLCNEEPYYRDMIALRNLAFYEGQGAKGFGTLIKLYAEKNRLEGNLNDETDLDEVNWQEIALGLMEE